MLITVHQEMNPWDAHIVMGRLRAEGLHPSLLSEHHVRMDWLVSTALGGVRIQVPLAEVDRAREVLDAWQAGLFRQAEEDDSAAEDPSTEP